MKRWSVLVDNSKDVSTSPAALTLFGKENIGWSVSTEHQSSSFILNCANGDRERHVSFWTRFPPTDAYWNILARTVETHPARSPTRQFVMTSIGTGYDLSASTYSPDGRIFQVNTT